MYAGTQKKAIVITSGENSIFEMAYFILKDDAKEIKESDMVREANKILKNNIIGGYFFNECQSKQKTLKNKGKLQFFLGVFLGAVLCLLITLFIK